MNFDMPVYEYAFLINKQNSDNVLSCNTVILTHSGIADTQHTLWTAWQLMRVTNQSGITL